MVPGRNGLDVFDPRKERRAIAIASRKASHASRQPRSQASGISYFVASAGSWSAFMRASRRETLQRQAGTAPRFHGSRNGWRSAE